MKQRWRVVSDLIAREGPEEYSRAELEVLPRGAVVEEMEMKGNRLRFTRLSGRGPYTGWVDVREGNRELLVKVEKKGITQAAYTEGDQGDLDGTAKRKKNEEKISWRPQPAAPEVKAVPPGYPRPGRFWKVVGAPKEGLTVWQGVSETSPKCPGTLPMGAVVEEVQVVGNRLSFTDFSMRGPPSGWVNIQEMGRDQLVVDLEGLSTLNIAEALKESAGISGMHFPEGEGPLSGWAKLGEMYQKPAAERSMANAAAAAAETADQRRRRRRTAPKELPQLEELAHASEEMLVDMLGFPEQEAKHFAMMNEESKRRVITECRALIDMSPSERQEAFEKLRKAWPQGPFPSFAKPSETLPPVGSTLLPAGTCFPLKRPSQKEQQLAPQLKGGDLAKSSKEDPLEQKAALQKLASAPAASGEEVVADPSAAAERMDLAHLPGKVEPERLAQSIIAKTKLNIVDTALFLTQEMSKRVVLMDSGPAAKLRSASLSEADFRGERAKVLRDSAPQLGNVELLSLSKPTLVLDTYKDYLKSGADICCTNTARANSIDQKDYKTTKLVSEMNKAAAQLAKRAAAEVTRQDPKKPRLVAGLVGSAGAAKVRLDFDDLVEAYSEQIKGLVEGGVDLLALEVADARRAKAAIYAAGEVYRQVKQRVPPMVINVIVDPATSRTLGGQTPDAFYVSVKHARPLAVGLISGGTGSLAKAYGALEKCESFVGLKADGKDWKEPPNLLGLADGLPPQLAQLAAECGKAASVRARPAGQKRLWVSGHESHKVDGFTVVAQRGTRASGKFKELLDDFKAGGGANALTKALKLCASEVAKGADVLDISADGIAGDGSNRGSKSAMSKFCALYDEDAVAKAPVMLCSADWKVLKAGLGHLQGRCIVNALCLMLGEDEFLRIAKECLKHGAALVVMAVGEQGRAVTSKDKVELLQRSYKLLRQKLDFPAEDIILDVHLQSLRHDEHPSEVIAAIKETRRLCPHASIACGLSNLSAAFGQLRQLREALHSVFLRHSVPLGLNMALTTGRLPIYENLDPEMLQVCEDVILNSKKDESALRRFMAFLSVRSGAAVCLPLQAANEAPLADAWWELPECKAAAKEAQAPYVNGRQIGDAASQKNFFQGLKPAYVSPIAQVPAEAGCERPAPWRVSSASGAGALQQQVSSALSSGTKIPERTLLAQLNLMLSKQVLIMDGPAGPAELLSSVKDEASFTGGRFPASAKNNLDLLAITKPDLVLNAHRALLKAGADLIRTNTRNGDVLCQDYYGTGAAVYELNKAAATLAKQAVQEAVSAEPQSLKFAAGVIGPSTGRLTAVKATTTWDQMVQAYRPQVKGLVDGGVHLLLLDMVSDTLNAKAAIYAVQEYFGCYPKERVPVIINVSVTKEGRTGSGQSLAACVASLMHAQPLAFGVGGDGAQEAVAQLTCPCWVQLTGAPKDAQANLVSPTGSKEQDVSACAKLRGSLATRPLPAAATAALRLSGLEVTSLAPEEGLKLIGQRCHVQGSQRFKGLVHACKYTSDEEVWEAALDVAKQQVEDKADLLDLNFDSPKIDAKKAMGSFVRRCGVNPSTASVPLVISSGTWDVIAEGLKNAQGKCIVNGLSLSSTEEEFLRGAEECRRFGAAVVILALSKSQFEFPNYQEKVGSCQRAFQLLRSKLDFPPEDIIFDCLLTPVGSEVRASPKDFTDAVAELKRTCPGSSFVAGVSNLSHGCRTVQMLRDALASSFLQQAVPKGLNLAFVELGHLPHPGSIEEPTKSICAEVLSNSAPDGPHVGRFLNFASHLAGADVANEALRKPRPANTLQRKDKTLVPIANVKAVEPLRPSPQFTNPVEILVQATGTINSSIFQTFGSKAHAAANYHRLSAATQINRTVHFSSISVYMGQGGSGPVTGASGLMDGLSLWERHQGVNHYATTVLWGAIGEIGLRKAIYGSRDVFAQFDLGQKLIGPADTAFLERQVCCNADTWDFVGLAYLDNTWKDSLAGTGGGGSGLSGRKTFLDN